MCVCMFEALKRLCMYASNIHTWNQTYIHSKLPPCFRKAFEHVCMFENPGLYRGNETYIHSQSCLKSKKNHPETPPKRVCMFQNHVFCHENETSTLKHKLSFFIKNHTFGASWACMYVWNPCVLSIKTAQTYTLSNSRVWMMMRIIHVCMFQNLVFYRVLRD